MLVYVAALAPRDNAVTQAYVQIADNRDVQRAVWLVQQAHAHRVNAVTQAYVPIADKRAATAEQRHVHVVA